jgi:hypothetical protein
MINKCRIIKNVDEPRCLPSQRKVILLPVSLIECLLIKEPDSIEESTAYVHTKPHTGRKHWILTS